MELSENDKHALRVDIARAVRDMADRIESNMVLAPRLETMIDVMRPELDKHDGDVIAAVDAGDMKIDSYFITLDIPREAL